MAAGDKLLLDTSTGDHLLLDSDVADVLELEISTKAVVVTSTLPYTVDDYVDLTSTDFGDVDAAIILVSRANTTYNPWDSATIGVGFWDGVNSAQSYCGITASDSQTTTCTRRSSSTSQAIYIQHPAPGVTYDTIYISCTASAVTNGIRLTVDESYTSTINLYVTALLIGGATDVHLGTQNLGTGTSPIDITAPGFKPSIVFFENIGYTAADSLWVQAIFSFGVAHNDSSDTVTQGMIAYHSRDSLTTSLINNYISDTKSSAQLTNDTLTYTVEAGSFDSSGFSVTPSADTGSDILFYLAIELPNADDAWVDTFTAATSTGTDSVTGTGFTPQAVGLMASTLTTLDSLSTSGSGITLSLFDDSTEASYTFDDEDGVTTTNNSSEYSANALLINFDDGSQDALAALYSLDSNGFTLNYSNAAASARQVLGFAIGNSSTSQNLSADFISAGTTLYEPTLSPGAVTLSVDFISAGTTLYTPDVTLGGAPQNLNADFIASGTTVYEPTVSPGSVTLSIDYISAGTVLYEPTLQPGAVTLSADYISPSTVLYEPTVVAGASLLSADFIPSGTTLYEPTVSPGAYTLSVDFISSATVLYEPTITAGNTIAVDFISSSTTLFEPDLVPGSVTLSADFISSGTTLYDPEVVSRTLLELDFISAGTTLYEPTLSPGAVTVDLDFIDTTSIYELSVNAGISQISADFISSGTTLYEPSLYGSYQLNTDFISSGSILYEPTLSTGSATISVDYISASTVLYQPMLYRSEVFSGITYELKLQDSSIGITLQDASIEVDI